MSAERKDTQSILDVRKKMQQVAAESPMANVPQTSAPQTSKMSISEYWHGSSPTLKGMLSQMGGKTGWSAGAELSKQAGEIGSAQMAKGGGKSLKELAEIRSAEVGRPVSTEAAGSNYNLSAAFANNASNLYDELDKRNVKTRDQAIVNMDEVIDKNPRLRAFFKDPAFEKQFPDYKNVVSQHYADLVRGRDQQASAPAPTLTKKVVEMETKPMGKKAVTEVKLRIPKK